MPVLNGSFSHWEDGECLVCPELGANYLIQFDNIKKPAPWVPWYRHEFGVCDKPEVRPAETADRIRSGTAAALLFTVWRNHCGGFLQEVTVKVGQRVRLAAWAHAWSNGSIAGSEHWLDNPHWSVGAGDQPFAALHEDLMPMTGHPYTDGLHNFAFTVGIDPTGGTDPQLDTVIWCKPWAIYNEYHQIFVDAVALGTTITLFLRSQTEWTFKHNDAYLEDVTLDVLSEPAGCRGGPRIQYERTYDVINADATEDEAVAIFRKAWLERKGTVGGSYDDAGGGDLDVRKVNAHGIAPDRGQSYLDWYALHYPGVDVTIVPGEASPPPPLPESGGTLWGLHLQNGYAGDTSDGKLREDFAYIRDVQPRVVKLVGNYQWARDIKALSPTTLVVARYHTDHQEPYYNCPAGAEAGARAWLGKIYNDLETLAPYIDYYESVNEEIPTHNNDKLDKLVEFDCWLPEVCYEEFGSDIKIIGLIGATGNPDVDEVVRMVKAARQIAKYHGAAGYHNYFGYNLAADYCPLEHGDEAKYFSMRALWGWDPVFKAAGIRIDYIGTESGPIYIGGGPGHWHASTAGGGWRWDKCMNGDFDLMLRLSMLGHSVQTVWNAANDDAHLGDCQFTLGGPTWGNFEYGPWLWRIRDAVLAAAR